MIHRKSARDLDRMAAAGTIVAETLALLAEAARPGMSTLDLDELAENHIRTAGGVPTFKGYRGFPGSICASPNTMIVHGIPSDEVVLADGDILSIDVGVTRQGFVGDSAVTIAIGEVPERTKQLLRTCQASLQAAVEVCQVGGRLGDIGAAVQGVVEGEGFAVVRDLVGHGVGRSMHEDPQVKNYGQAGTGAELKAGMTLAIEPMITDGSYEIQIDDDGWSIYTVDDSLAAHFEHTVAITDEGPRVLTLVNGTSIVNQPI
ncbi:MAG: type I methionyl aminopeptidase [Thermoleophilia bacterium]